MRVAKYDAATSNPGGRETLRFRFSDQELQRIGGAYGKGSARYLRFNLVMMARGKAKLVPTPVGGMAVTTSPSGKNYPWEVGFNHHSSPDILEVPAMSSCHAEMIIEPDGLVVDLPDIRRARRINARAAKLEAVDLLRTELTKKLEEANALAASLGISLSVSENAQQGAV